MDIKIYGLIDPRTNEIRYIGKTKLTLKVRLMHHMVQKPKHNSYKHNWICSLKKENIKPIIIELESCDDTNWVEREKYWIKQYENLTNLTTGGDGCNYFSPDALSKISNASKRMWSNPEHRINQSIKHKGISRPDDVKKRISDGRKNKQQISIDGIIYQSITDASKLIPMNRDKIKGRLISKNFPDYYKIKKEV